VVARAVARSPERVAWTVLLSAFIALVSIVAIILVGGRWWLRSASVGQAITIVYNSGTVLVTRPGRGAPEVNLTDIPVGSVIRSEPNAQASLTFMSSATGEILATVRVFGGTILEVVEADSPRFSTGVDPHRLTLRVTSGRVRANVAVDLQRPVRIELHSDPAAVTVLDTAGSNVSVEAGPTETIVTVREGQAVVDAYGGSVLLGRDQRAEVVAESAPRGPLPAEQNWVKNGDFADALGEVWHVAADKFDPDEELGKAIVLTNGGRHVLQFNRSGVNWARVGVTQDINRDVQGLTSLRLNMDIFISAQNVRNCGQFGTECPLMVKINYVDVGGGTQEWLQGFYWFYDPNPAFGLTYCGFCSVPFAHILWQWATWQPYSSDNLLQVFAANGTPAASIKSVTIYAEGHSFTSMVADVQLLASE
jgi:hypothetical protein